MDYSIEELYPFGIIIRNKGNNHSIEQFPPQQIEDWISINKLIVFRGYVILPKQELALFAQKLGKPLQWAFGAINELKVKPDTENYIFTDHEVPLHWDGAFVGTIPHIILFQCIVAPKKEDLGGTTFSNTSKILENLPTTKRKEWEHITITYTTKKIVHYGGKIVQPLLQQHKVNETEVIRYAEPVDDLNPVTLDIKGLQNQTADSFIKEMKATLYEPQYLYTHRWEINDIVLADNHTLLHGREAFSNPNERYIQRINILQRPKSFSLLRYINNCLTIRRKEFFVAELPIFIIPLLLSISSPSNFLNPFLYLGLFAIILLFNMGDMINCYTDYKLDSIYKSHLSNAVYELGKKNVKLQIILSGIMALFITSWIAIATHQLYLIPLTIVGGFVGLQYSIKPFKFKSRGIWQLICLWGIIFFGPMIYTAIITNGFPSFLQILLFTFYGFHQMGIILLNTAEDYTEDKAIGLKTIIIILGLHKAMNFAFYLVLFSGLLMQFFFSYFLFQNNAIWYLYLFTAIFTIGWFEIVLEYKIIIHKINALTEEDAIKEIKKNGMKVPRWLKIGAYTFLVPITAFFLWHLFKK
jgi:alpha-ketoglutarate-dependent taurine dioxygenase/4-hydroxybenzoate polyprenyltransferase